MMENNMHTNVSVKIIWLTSIEGGRQSPPPLTGIYYPITQLPYEPNSWSLAIKIIYTWQESEHWISEGDMQFLVEHAPHHLLKELKQIEIYEGPKKVADVFIQFK
ncbi:hypothetical protein [Shigella sp. FC1655]|uniref:hypothetical protein n=2 Tax=Gammaproteobacteria TaxID=1236 RepID=UPI001493924C|nr:hypothetical protein [Shigella sp. FC1655]